MSELTTKDLFNQIDIKKRFETLLGKKSQGFITSVLQTVNNNKLLQSADPQSILTAAATAATLDLPINQNLGFAWIVPYKGEAQFQIGWKGFVQLALRTNQYKSINVIEVHENQFKSFNQMTEELDADFNLEGTGEVVAYAAYFKLINGFEKTVVWSRKKVETHAKKYSKAYTSSLSPWSSPDTFHAMAKKTVLKNTLSKFGIMSIELQSAISTDQAVMSEDSPKYVDNPRTIDIEALSQIEEGNRIEKSISNAKTLEQLNKIEEALIMEEAYTNETQILIETQKTKI
jgi:recombination protein RecT